jgi:dolichol-phosphate hexosyltransferase
LHAGLVPVAGECERSGSLAEPRLTRVGERAERGGAGNDTVLRQTSRRLSRQREYVKLSVIMAVFNGQETIEQAVEEVLSVQYPCEVELIVVDQGSTDKTPDLLGQITDPRVVTIRHGGDQENGAALVAGVMAASGTHILPFDANLEYLPDDILNVLEPVLTGRCSVVYGVRLFGYNTVYRSYRYALGNRIFTLATNVMFGSCLSDVHTCLKLIPTNLLRSLEVRETGFGLNTEISAALLRRGVRPFEVPVSYFGRARQDGEQITWRDALRCLWIMLRVRVQSPRDLSSNGAHGSSELAQPI